MNKILGTIDLSSYKSLNGLYDDLLALKKDPFEDTERIIIRYNSNDQLALINELLLVVDIPDFFVVFEPTDQPGGITFKFADNFCIYPWINLRVSTTGNVSPCCMFNGTIENANIKDADLQTVYQSKFMQGLRQSFLNNKRPNQCSACWADEAVGKPSMRQRAKYKFKEIYYRLDYQTESINNLQLLDLNLGNSCNLGCKICNRESSSTIAAQDHLAGNISTIEFKNLKASVKWAETEEFWSQLLDIIQNIKYLDLYGGEPLMSKAHFTFLKKLIDLDVAKNIKIDYNSNGTVYSDHFFDLWDHFKEIKISFSIDDIGSRFEEQRCGASWNAVCNNLEKFNSKRSDKFITEVYPTVNTQNVYWLPELIEWYNTQSFDHLSFNLLYAPAEYIITALSAEEKQKVINKFNLSPSHAILDSIVQILKD